MSVNFVNSKVFVTGAPDFGAISSIFILKGTNLIIAPNLVRHVVYYSENFNLLSILFFTNFILLIFKYYSVSNYVSGIFACE